MRKVLFAFALVPVLYSCLQSSGREPNSSRQSAPSQTATPPDDLRVGKIEAMVMRSRRGKDKDDASLKISAKDLLSLMKGAPGDRDSFIFYLVRYDNNSAGDKKRYARKVPGHNWNDVMKKSTSMLVGFASEGATQTMRLAPRPGKTTVELFDLAVLCPPPPDCNCDIAQ